MCQPRVGHHQGGKRAVSRFSCRLTTSEESQSHPGAHLFATDSPRCTTPQMYAITISTHAHRWRPRSGVKVPDVGSARLHL